MEYTIGCDEYGKGLCLHSVDVLIDGMGRNACVDKATVMNSARRKITVILFLVEPSSWCPTCYSTVVLDDPLSDFNRCVKYKSVAPVILTNKGIFFPG